MINKNLAISKYKIQDYKPFSKKTDFVLFVDEKDNVQFLKNKKLGYVLKIRKGGYIPKTGILLSECLDKLSKKPRLSILDVGTGEAAFLAIHAAYLWGKEVVAIDIDKTALEWAKINVDINNLSRRVKLIKCSVSSMKDISSLDLIVSNPPQMPVEKNHSVHDDGGVDGRKYIVDLIKLAEKSLKEGGILLFNVFDFLSVEEKYGVEPSLLEILTKHSFRVKIINSIKKEIKPGSYTSRNLSHIKKIYPKYVFKRGTDKLYRYKVLSVYAEKIKNYEK